MWNSLTQRGASQGLQGPHGLGIAYDPRDPDSIARAQRRLMTQLGLSRPPLLCQPPVDSWWERVLRYLRSPSM